MASKFSKFQSCTYIALILFILNVSGKCRDEPLSETNLPPTALILSNLTVSENQPVASQVGIFSTTDSDVDDTHTYSLVNGEGDSGNNSFVIDGINLNTNAIFDFEVQNTYSIRVQTDDGNDGGIFQMIFIITVADIAEVNTPTTTILSNASVNENAAIGTNIGFLTTTGGNLNDDYTYALVSGDGDDGNNSFVIDGINLNTNAIFDFEVQNTYSIRVQTDDGNDGGIFQMIFIITVADIAEVNTPTTTILSNASVNENAAIGTNIGFLTTTGENLNDDYTYALVSGDGDDGNNSVLLSGDTLKVAAIFDYEQKVSYNIRIRSTPTSGASFEQTFTILINNLTGWSLATDNSGWAGNSHHGSVVFDNKIWAMGGYTITNNVWSSNVDGLTWTKITDSADWNARVSYTSVVFDNKIWITGGFNGSNGLNDVWYSPDGLTWTEANAAADWTARWRNTSVVFNNKIWVIGGTISTSILKNDIWSSSDGITWTEVNASASWEARTSHTSVVFDNKIWVIGGENFSTAFNDIWSSSDGITWTEVNASASWEARRGHQSVVFDNKIWIIGGFDFSSEFFDALNDVWSSADGVTWNNEAPGPSSWTGGGKCVIFNNKIWRIGGYELINDLWCYDL